MLCKNLGRLSCGRWPASAVNRMVSPGVLPSKRHISAGVPLPHTTLECQRITLVHGQLSIGDVVFTYPGTLIPARLIKRYKRFLADVQIDGRPSGTVAVGAALEPTVTTVHCPNTGPMIGLLNRPLAPVYLSTSSNKGRKYIHTLEMIQPDAQLPTWVGIHSAKANAIVASLLEKRAIPALGEYATIQAEVKSGPAGKSRVDFLLQRSGGGLVFVEVKSVTLTEDVAAAPSPSAAPKGSRRGLFPDTVSERAQRHVRDAMAAVAAGHEAAMIFCVQRGDCDHSVSPCKAKDPVHSGLVREASDAGVQMIAVLCELRVDAAGCGTIHYGGELPFVT